MTENPSGAAPEELLPPESRARAWARAREIAARFAGPEQRRAAEQEIAEALLRAEVRGLGDERRAGRRDRVEPETYE